MTASANVKAAFDGAHLNFNKVSQYLTGSAESADEPQMVLIGALLDTAEPLLELWRKVAGADGAARAGGTITAKLSEIRTRLFRVGHTMGANGEGTNTEAHLAGTANTLDGLINLLGQATGTGARSPAILRKEATGLLQTAQHRYGLALRAPDTNVDLERKAAHHEGRVELTRRLHRGVVDMTIGVEAWTR